MDVCEFPTDRFYNHKEIATLTARDFTRCGIYFLILDDTVVYIGQSTDIDRRIKEHQDKEFDRVVYMKVKGEDLDFMESFYIRNIEPDLNTVHKAPLSKQMVCGILESKVELVTHLFFGTMNHHIARGKL